jgi:hypothetical protein
MVETVHITQRIKDMLTNMVLAKKEYMTLALGERVSDTEIFVTNSTVPFEGDYTSVSPDAIPGFDSIVNAVLFANTSFRQRGGSFDRFNLFWAHSHPRMIGQVVRPGWEAWSVDDVPKKYEASRGRAMAIEDSGGNLLHFSLSDKSDGKSGDDVFFQLVAETYSTIQYTFFARPPAHLVGKPMTREVAIDCYRYDPSMVLGKIRKIPIADEVLTPPQLTRTLLDPSLSLANYSEESRRIVLPYRRRR